MWSYDLNRSNGALTLYKSDEIVWGIAGQDDVPLHPRVADIAQAFCRQLSVLLVRDENRSNPGDLLGIAATLLTELSEVTPTPWRTATYIDLIQAAYHNAEKSNP